MFFLTFTLSNQLLLVQPFMKPHAIDNVLCRNVQIAVFFKICFSKLIFFFPRIDLFKRKSDFPEPCDTFIRKFSLRGLSRNKICIGAAIDEDHNVLLLSEGFGKPSQKVSYEAFVDHISPNSTLIHDGEKSHKKLIADLSLIDEQHSTKETKSLEDFENPLDPVNHIHYLTKRFLYSHSGFDRSQIQDYLNLYSFILNPPFDKLEKVDKLLNLVFENPKLLRYREQFNVNT